MALKDDTNIAGATNILLCVIGGTPQVLTETLFGIYRGELTIKEKGFDKTLGSIQLKKEAMPTKIKVITTCFGLQEMRNADMFGPKGKVNDFIDEYSLKELPFTEADCWVIENKNGQPLDDARTTAEHADIADFITEKVRYLTQAKQENNKSDKYAIHASIAGGRKSMTFFLGYAMSLFARPQDKLSHVLVSAEIEREKARNFFYPKKHEENDNKVFLAEIPIVSIKGKMSNTLLQESRSYSETIRLFEDVREKPTLTLYVKPSVKNKFSIKCNDKLIVLGIKEMSLLLAFAQNNEPVSMNKDPENTKLGLKIFASYAYLLSGVEQYFVSISEGLHWLAKYREQIKNKNKHDTAEGGDNALVEADKVAKNEDTFLLGKNTSLQDALACKNDSEDHTRKPLGGVVGGQYYQKLLDNLKKIIVKQIGEELANYYIPIRVAAAQGDSKARKGKYLYRLNIIQNNIHIINASEDIT